MIKVAIIGAGAIAPSHIKAYQTFTERCKIVALCDLQPGKAEELAKSLDLQVEIYQEYEELIAHTDVDLVSICTPPYTHAEISVAFLRAGKHVLVEKPMAASLEECDVMNEAARTNNKVLSVVAQNRFMTPVMKLKHVLDSKLLGQIVHVQVDSFWWRGHSYYDLWWRGTWEKEGGGCTLNHAVHHIDIFQWLTGMPQEVTAISTNTSHDNAEVEDLSIAICRLDDRSLAQITSSVVHHGQEQQLIFQGEKARVSVPWKLKASRALPNGFPEDDQELEKDIQRLYDQYSPLQYEGHIGQVDDVLQAIEGKKEVLIDGEQGRRTLELITAIYQSASIKESVSLPLNTNSPFYTREGLMKHVPYYHKKQKSIMNFDVNDITTGGNY